MKDSRSGIRDQGLSLNIWQISDLCTPMCVHVAVTLRIAQHIDAGKSRIEQLAEAARADCDALHRVLRHLVEKGVFEEPSHGEFALNEPARMLLDSAATLGLDLDGMGGRMAYAWSTLLDAVRTGAPAYHRIFGRPFWDDLKAHPAIAEQFDALMGPAGHGIPDPDIAISGGWEPVRTVVDVGGGTGAFLAEILRAHPHVRGTLVDLPATVLRTAELFQSAGVSDRVTTVAQSFFDPLPAGADLYLLKSVLEDWPDREAGALLERCADAARPSGRVLVLSGVTPHDPPPELLMLMLVGGKHRRLPDFSDLARAAGLTVQAADRQRGRFVVECATIADP